jgi:hypothetical protein
MNKLLIVTSLVFILACSKAIPITKFHFGDRVKAIDGFFVGCVGNIKDYNFAVDKSHGAYLYDLVDVSCPKRSDLVGINNEPEEFLMVESGK